MKIIQVEFEHLADHIGYQAKATVAVSGDDVEVIDLVAENWHGGEPSDFMLKVLEQKAEQLAWEQANPPKNRRTGCECPPYGEGTLAEMVHDDTCPIRLSRVEREAYNDLVRKEDRQRRGN